MGIALDYVAGIISITAPTTLVTVEELITAIRQSEDDLANMTYPYIIDTAGKSDLGGGVTTGITLTLSSLWQIQFWNRVVRGTIKDGNVVGGVGGVPIKNTGGNDTILQLGAVATSIAEGDAEAIADAIWDEDLTTHTTSKTAGWFVKKIKAITDAILAMVT